MRKILVPVDFSEVTERAIDAAADMAKAFGAKIYLVHVEDPDPAFMGYEPGPQWVRDSVAKEMQGHHKDLEGLEKRLKEEGVDVSALLIQGPITEKILEESDRVGADLIIAGTHGRGKLHKMILGSVSQELIKARKCPVMLINSTDKRLSENEGKAEK